MFEYRKGSSPEEVAALFGDGIQPIYKYYVEDPDTGDLLVYSGGLGRDEEGRVYLLRWRGRTIGFHTLMTAREGTYGIYRLFTLKDLGSSSPAKMWTRVAHVDLAPDEAAVALRVAAEACVVLETYLGVLGPEVRVSDPDGSGRELSPADFGYPEIARAPLDVQ